MRCTHWVLDLDGTLTVAAHDFDAIRATLGLPVGLPILEQLAAIATTDPGRAAALHVRLGAIEAELADTAVAADGAAAFLDAVRTRGDEVAILTRNDSANVVRTLRAAGLDGFFDLGADVVSRDDAAPKPAPDGVEVHLRRWGADPAAAAMVGDYRFDLEAGRAAGVRCAEVDPSGAFPWAHLADVSVRRLPELLAAGW